MLWILHQAQRAESPGPLPGNQRPSWPVWPQVRVGWWWPEAQPLLGGLPQRDMWRVKLQVSLLARKWGLGSGPRGGPQRNLPARAGGLGLEARGAPLPPAAPAPAPRPQPPGRAETGRILPGPVPAEARRSQGEPAAPSACIRRTAPTSVFRGSAFDLRRPPGRRGREGPGSAEDPPGRGCEAGSARGQRSARRLGSCLRSARMAGGASGVPSPRPARTGRDRLARPARFPLLGFTSREERPPG